MNPVNEVTGKQPPIKLALNIAGGLLNLAFAYSMESIFMRVVFVLAGIASFVVAYKQSKQPPTIVGKGELVNGRVQLTFCAPEEQVSFNPKDIKEVIYNKRHVQGKLILTSGETHTFNDRRFATPDILVQWLQGFQ